MADQRQFWRWLIAIGALLLLGTNRAEAHLVTTGLGPVYDGISHFVTSPDDILPALALALFAGLRGPLPGRRALFALPLTWLAGGLLGVLLPSFPPIPTPVGAGILAATFLVFGLLVAADLPLPPMAVIALAIVLGLIHGFIDGLTMTEDGAAPSTATLQLLGIMATLFVLMALASAMVISLRPAWTRIAVRVAGSWIAAMGLFWLGWSLNGRG